MSGPAFFSGGTALASVASEFAAREESPSFIITTFDSGGSTQAIRRVFDMPAVGDLRNRLLAAANPSCILPSTLSFLRRRVAPGLSGDRALADLRSSLNDPALRQDPDAAAIAADLESFLAAMPPDFDAARASIGNIALTGAWLDEGRSIAAAIDRYARLFSLKAAILPVCEQSLHMGAELESGQILIGQHILARGTASPVRRIFLTRTAPWQSGPVREERPPAFKGAISALREADLICFPMGSFYSSVLVSLLPEGIGRAIAESRAMKVFIPNSGADPESADLDLGAQVERLLALLRLDAPDAPAARLLNAILIDSANGQYRGRIGAIPSGIRIEDRAVVESPGRHDPKALRAVLMEMACAKA